MAVESQAAKLHKKMSPLTDFVDPQEALPYWARSTNPIVRRHLGLYWRTIPPEIKPFVWIISGWALVIGVSILFPPLFGFTMIAFLASLIIMPFTMLLYGHILLTVALDANRAMQQEFANNTFNLLRSTPMTLSQIFLGKVAAAIWRRMDDLVMVAQLALVFSPPILFAVYNQLFPVSERPIAASLLTLLGMVILLGRAILEPLMVGVLSVFIGMVVPGRGRSVTAAVVIASFYFLLLNLFSYLPMVRGYETPEGMVAPNANLIITIDFILPIVIPAILIYSLIKLAETMITRD